MCFKRTITFTACGHVEEGTELCAEQEMLRELNQPQHVNSIKHPGAIDYTSECEKIFMNECMRNTSGPGITLVSKKLCSDCKTEMDLPKNENMLIHVKPLTKAHILDGKAPAINKLAWKDSNGVLTTRNLKENEKIWDSKRPFGAGIYPNVLGFICIITELFEVIHNEYCTRDCNATNVVAVLRSTGAQINGELVVNTAVANSSRQAITDKPLPMTPARTLTNFATSIKTAFTDAFASSPPSAGQPKDKYTALPPRTAGNSKGREITSSPPSVGQAGKYSSPISRDEGKGKVIEAPPSYPESGPDSPASSVGTIIHHSMISYQNLPAAPQVPPKDEVARYFSPTPAANNDGAEQGYRPLHVGLDGKALPPPPPMISLRKQEADLAAATQASIDSWAAETGTRKISLESIKNKTHPRSGSRGSRSSLKIIEDLKDVVGRSNKEDYREPPEDDLSEEQRKKMAKESIKSWEEETGTPAIDFHKLVKNVEEKRSDETLSSLRKKFADVDITVSFLHSSSRSLSSMTKLTFYQDSAANSSADATDSESSPQKTTEANNSSLEANDGSNISSLQHNDSSTAYDSLLAEYTEEHSGVLQFDTDFDQTESIDQSPRYYLSSPASAPNTKKQY